MKNKLKVNKITLILLSIVVVLIIAIISILLGFKIRNNIINKQIQTSMNMDDKVAVIYSSGKNITLSQEIYNNIKENEVDIIIVNKNYSAKIKNQDLTQHININVEMKKASENKLYVDFNGTTISELYVNVRDNLKNLKYVSEFYNDGTTNVYVANDVIVNNEGYGKLQLVENAISYTLEYVELDVEQLSSDNLVINKSENKRLDLGISPEYYTYNSYTIESVDKDSIQIDEDNNITAKQVGEYTIIIKNSIASKEMKINVIQAVEKIELSKSTIELVVGNSIDIDANVLPEDATNKEINWTSNNEGIATVDSQGNITAIAIGNCEIVVSSLTDPVVSATVQVSVIEKPILQLPSLGEEVEGITYINGILLVNKNHPVPKDYAPGLLQIVYNAFLELQQAAAQAGYDMPLLSGYRSYDLQTSLYNNYVATYGQAEADTFSARPGTSEHQTGLAMDVGWIDDAFADTPAGKWLAENCYKYGFIIRYQKDKESITGYKYEPWHIRYLGKDIAEDVYNSGLCLEEYLGVN